MAKKESEKSKALRCCRLTFNVSLMLAFIFFILIPVLQSYAASWNYTMNPSSWTLLQAFTDFFIIGFAIIYFVASLTILIRFYWKRRLCRMDNCSFYIFTLGVFALSLIGSQYIDKAAIAHTEDFQPSCAELALKESISPNSFLAEVNTIYKSASDLMCSQSCPCALRGGVDDGRVLQTEKKLQSQRRQLKTFKDANGPTSVPKCDKYTQRVFGNDDDKEHQFTEFFASLEETHSCSGICDGIDEKNFDLYLFSNINDGDPVMSCR